MQRRFRLEGHCSSSFDSEMEGNFNTITQLRDFKIKRCIVPGDAVSLDMGTFEMGDSTLHLACSAIYIRFKRKPHVQAYYRSLSIPQSELFCSSPNRHYWSCTRVVFTVFYQEFFCLIDSQIPLFWITNTPHSSKRMDQK